MMTRFVLALIRFIALAMSFLLSTLVAAAFVTFVLFLGSDVTWLNNDPAVIVGSFGFLTGVWFVLARTLFVPFIGVVFLAEFLRLSTLLTNLLMGGLMALIFMIPANGTKPGRALEHSALPYPDSQVWLVAIAAGIVGGFAHWLLAGHRAGRWLGQPKEEI